MAKIWTNPGEVKGLGPRRCNCGDVMNNHPQKKKIANAPSSPCTVSIHYTARVWNKSASQRLVRPPPPARGWKRMTGKPYGLLLFFTEYERDSTAFKGSDRTCNLVAQRKRNNAGARASRSCPSATASLSLSLSVCPP